LRHERNILEKQHVPRVRPPFLENLRISCSICGLATGISLEPATKGPVGIAFGRFLLLPHRRELLEDGRAVRLGARAFDVLMAFGRGARSRCEQGCAGGTRLARRIVQDTALQSQISALRAALGADRDLILTVSGRGYQFVGEIHDDAARRANEDYEGRAAPRPPARVPPTNLPGPVSELIGRDKELREVEDLAANHRLVILTGAGGIGKTRLALAVARRLLPRFSDGVWVVDFWSVSDPSLVPATIAVAVGVDPGGSATRQHVAHALAARPLLLVLDTCEHVVGAMAAMAEELLRAGAAAHVIATAASRSARRENGSIQFFLSPYPRKMRAMTTSRSTARGGCFSSGREPLNRILHPIHRTQRRLRRSVDGSMVSRWRSSWRPRGSGHSAPSNSLPISPYPAAMRVHGELCHRLTLGRRHVERDRPFRRRRHTRNVPTVVASPQQVPFRNLLHILRTQRSIRLRIDQRKCLHYSIVGN
jgi:DNA-binding winged helix-turn-helix (wHTH) protein